MIVEEVLHRRYGAATNPIWTDRRTDGQTDRRPRNLLYYMTSRSGAAPSLEERPIGWFGGKSVPLCLHTVSGSDGVMVRGVSAIPRRADPSQAARSGCGPAQTVVDVRG